MRGGRPPSRSYQVFAINPLQVARPETPHRLWGRSDIADAPTSADMVRTDCHQLRPVAADSAGVEAIKVVSRAHKTSIWKRTRHGQGLRHALRGLLPGRPGRLRRPHPPSRTHRSRHPAAAEQCSGPRLGGAADTTQIVAALRRARRRTITARGAAIEAALREQHLQQPAVLTAAYAATVRALVAILTTLNEQITVCADLHLCASCTTASDRIDAQLCIGPFAHPTKRWRRSLRGGCHLVWSAPSPS